MMGPARRIWAITPRRRTIQSLAADGGAVMAGREIVTPESNPSFSEIFATTSASGGMLLWDGLWRKWYQIESSGLCNVAGGSTTRGRLIKTVVEHLSPLGRTFTEDLRNARRPSIRFKTPDQLRASACRTNLWMNEVGRSARWLGAGLVVVDIGRTFYVIN